MPFPLTPALAPLSALYGAAVETRAALYRAGLLPVYESPRPIVSVGNMTAGGTGKTPLVAWLARAAAATGARVCVLTRGYGRADERRRVVVSDGLRLLAGAGQAGDEPRLLAETLLDARVSVVSDADRAAASRWASRELGAEAFVLDDGFQHLRLFRDLDVVTIDATDPWGGRRLLPAGRLREPLRNLRRADAVVLTRADLARDLTGLRAEASRLSGEGVPILTARLCTTRLLPHDKIGDPQTSASAAAEALRPTDMTQPAGAFCAVGNPRAFFAHLRRDGHDLAYTRAFADHHAYTSSDLESVARAAAASGARALLTTAKDAVKLRGAKFPLPCYVVEVALEVDEAEKLLGLLKELLGDPAGWRARRRRRAT